MKDLVVVVADPTMRQALTGLLERPEALGIRRIKADIFEHAMRDPGCALHGVEFASGFSRSYRYGLLMFDHEGSGKEHTNYQELQDMLNKQFLRSPWNDRARAILFSPELETWIWVDSPHVSTAVRWRGGYNKLRGWLVEQGHLRQNEAKPARPKEALEAALRKSGTPRSSRLYLQLAKKVSLKRCSDAAFLELKKTLQEWFPPG